MQGLISSNPIYLSALKNDRHFVHTKQYHFNNTATTIFTNGDCTTNFYKILLRSDIQDDNSKIIDFSELKLKSEFTLGKYQVDTETPSDIVWRIVDQKEDYQIAMSKYAVDMRCFDALEANNVSGKNQYGYGRWDLSNIKQFLNSDQATWYSAQHSYDTAPSKEISWNRNNFYNTHKGFLYYWNDAEKYYLQNMTIPIVICDVDGGGTRPWTGKVWLPTITQLGLGLNNNYSEGTQFSAITSNNDRLVYPSKSCATYNPDAKSNSWTTNTSISYWTSSTQHDRTYGIQHVLSAGATTNVAGTIRTDKGIVPCIKLPRKKSIITQNILVTLSKKHNNVITEIGKIPIDNINNTGVLLQDIELLPYDSLIASYDNASITTEYTMVCFCK